MGGLRREGGVICVFCYQHYVLGVRLGVLLLDLLLSFNASFIIFHPYEQIDYGYCVMRFFGICCCCWVVESV